MPRLTGPILYDLSHGPTDPHYALGQYEVPEPWDTPAITRAAYLREQDHESHHQHAHA